MAEQVITIDFLIEHLCKKENEPHSEDTITHYNNDIDISNHKIEEKMNEDKKMSKREKNEKILKGMLKDELVNILLNFYGTNVKKTVIKKKKVNDLIQEILDNDISF